MLSRIRSDLLVFVAQLRDDQKIKSPYFSIGGLVKKVEALSTLQGAQGFGFPAGCLPDDICFTRVARFVDRTNLLGLFAAQ